MVTVIDEEEEGEAAWGSCEKYDRTWLWIYWLGQNASQRGGNGFFEAVSGGAAGSVFCHGSRSDQNDRSERERGRCLGSRSRSLLIKAKLFAGKWFFCVLFMHVPRFYTIPITLMAMPIYSYGCCNQLTTYN